MTDHVVVTGLRVPARIGVTEEERAEPQMLVINLDIAADLSNAGESDNLDDTIDYDALVTRIAGLVEGTEVRLLERMATLVVAEVAKVKGAAGVTVEILKEKVPVEEDVADVRVRIERLLG